MPESQAPLSKSRRWLYMVMALLPLCLMLAATEWYLREQTNQRLQRKLDRNQALRKSVTIHQASRDPVLIYELRPGSEADMHGVHYRINSQGFRDDEFGSLKAMGATRRAIVLGDSVAWGWGVEMNDAWPQRLELALKSRHPQWQVCNLAVNGYATRQEARMLELRGLGYQPDLVILHYVLNDTEAEDGGLSWYYNNKGRFETWQQLKFFMAYLLAWMEHYTGKNSDSASAPPLEAADHFYLTHEVLFGEVEQGFAEIRRLTNDKKIPVLVVVTPVFQYKQNQPYPWAAIHEKIRKLSAINGFAYLDTAPLFIDKPPASVALDPIHPNASGHGLIAEAVLRYAESSGLIQ